MKKSNMLVQKLMVILFTLSVVGCGKNGVTGIDTQKCEARAKALVDATTLYTSSPNKSNCEGYKKALLDFVNEGVGCGVSDSELSAARTLIETLTCQ